MRSVISSPWPMRIIVSDVHKMNSNAGFVSGYPVAKSRKWLISSIRSQQILCCLNPPNASEPTRRLQYPLGGSTTHFGNHWSRWFNSLHTCRKAVDLKSKFQPRWKFYSWHINPLYAMPVYTQALLLHSWIPCLYYYLSMFIIYTYTVWVFKIIFSRHWMK